MSRWAAFTVIVLTGVGAGLVAHAITGTHWVGCPAVVAGVWFADSQLRPFYLRRW